MNKLINVFNGLKEVAADKERAKYLYALIGLMATGLITIIIFIGLIFNKGEEKQIILPDPEPTEEELVEQRKEDGLEQWAIDNLENENTLEFGDVIFQPMQISEIPLHNGANLKGVYGDHLLFVDDNNLPESYGVETESFHSIINYSYYSYLSKDGRMAYIERSDGFESMLVRIDMDTKREEIMGSYPKSSIVLDVIDIDGEKGLFIVKDTVGLKTTVHPFYSLNVAAEVGMEFGSYKQDIPLRSMFYRDGETIGIISNKNRMEWNGKTFVEVEKWGDDRFVGSYNKKGSITSFVYFDEEDQPQLLVNGTKLEIEGTVTATQILTERVLAFASTKGLFFYDLEKKEFHRMNEAFDVHLKDNVLYVEKMNAEDHEATLFELTFTKK